MFASAKTHLCGLVKWVAGFAINLNASFKLVLMARKERVDMKIFLRSKEDANIYFSAEPKAENRYTNVHVYWKLKKVGHDETIICSTHDIANKYEPCSPYEALSVIHM